MRPVEHGVPLGVRGTMGHRCNGRHGSETEAKSRRRGRWGRGDESREGGKDKGHASRSAQQRLKHLLETAGGHACEHTSQPPRPRKDSLVHTK